MPHLSLLATAALFALTTVACSGPPETVQPETPPKPEFSTGLTLEPGYARQLGYTTRWVHTQRLGQAQRLRVARPFGDLFITLANPGNLISAIRVGDATPLWKTVVGGDLDRAVGIVADDEHVYVNTTQRLYTLDRKDGELIAVSNLEHAVLTGPALVGRQAIFGAVNGRVYSHDVVAGYTQWQYGLTTKIVVPPLVSEKDVFAVDSAGHYAMLEAVSGDLQWRNATFGPVTVPPVLDRSFIILASEDQSLYSLNAATGARRWRPYRTPESFVEPPVVLGNAIYQIETGAGLTSIDSNTGERLWSQPRTVKPVTLRSEDRLVAYTDRSLVVLDVKTGKIVEEVPTKPLRRVVAGPDGSMILIGRDGEMVRLDPRS